ncbi:MAG: shikimate dehydrogenase family protein [Solirubrobacteraceae bacterium]
MPRLGVLGWPVAHSRSPAMQEAALKELGLEEWSYQRLPVPPELFVETVRALPRNGFVGANVTIPHKEAALALATVREEVVDAIGAANTLTFVGDDIVAANTDAAALLALAPEDPGRALVLGAGGSARAAVWALRRRGAETLVWGRTHERAVALAAELGATAVGPGALDEAGHAGAGRAIGRGDDFDVIVNCTPVGLMAGDDPFSSLPLGRADLERARMVIDLAYAAEETTLVAAARAAGVPAVVDGLEILVAQGALSLERWTGRRAPAEVMRRAAAGAR